LVEAARQEFSLKGIAGARVDAIAARAGVNKQLVYHYFGSKDELFREVLRLRLSTPIPVPADDKPATGERLAAVAQRLVDNPDHVRLLMWEALESGPDGPITEESARRSFYEGLIEQVREAQAAGEIDEQLDPAQVVLTRMALTMFPAAFPQLARLVTGLSVDDPVFSQRRGRFLASAYRR